MSTNPLVLPPLPPSLKSITGILRTATDVEKHDPAVGYWARFYACQVALGIDKSSPEGKAFLSKMMLWLEKVTFLNRRMKIMLYIQIFPSRKNHSVRMKKQFLMSLLLTPILKTML